MWFYDGEVGKLAMMLVQVQAVADDETVVDREADELNWHIC